MLKEMQRRTYKSAMSSNIRVKRGRKQESPSQLVANTKRLPVTLAKRNDCARSLSFTTDNHYDKQQHQTTLNPPTSASASFASPTFLVPCTSTQPTTFGNHSAHEIAPTNRTTHSIFSVHPSEDRRSSKKGMVGVYNTKGLAVARVLPDSLRALT